MEWEVCMKKYLIFGLLFAALISSPVFAANVSFLVIESGFPTGQRNEFSIAWENNLLEVFFDSGHIVSNAPVLQLNHIPDGGFPYEAERDYEQAQEGGMDYFLVVILEHPGNKVSLRLFNTRSRQMVHEHIYSETVLRSARDEDQRIKNAARNITGYLR
jgi:hypothetical protein